MPTFLPGYNFGTTEEVTSAKLALLVSSATMSAIVNTDVDASAAIAWSKLSTTGAITNSDINSSASIADTKLAQITTASKVSGAALTSLSSIPSGAGTIPSANLPAQVGIGTIDTVSDDSTTTATTDGFAISTATSSNGALDYVRITVVANGSTFYSIAPSGGLAAYICVPVKKGNSYNIKVDGTGTPINILRQFVHTGT